MNEQPALWIGNLFAFIFVAMIIFNTIKAYRDPNSVNKFNDAFTIGYIYDRPLVNVKSVSKPIVKPKTVKSAKPQLTQLQIDCTDALVALGMKKTQAKQKANEVFQNHSFDNIQDFLSIALKK
jgi:hypothetical protein